jgi:3-oxoacyl-[acyl-carrier protein] reductase
MKVSDVNAIVTGGASGIGLATARVLLEAGAPRVGILARDPAKVEAAAKTLGEQWGSERVVSLEADVRDPAALERCFDAFLEAAGKLHVLVNSAGVLLDGAVVSFSFKGVSRYPLDAWRTTLDTNLTGTFLCSQLAIERMLRKRTRGVIVNVSSVSRKGRPGQAAYSATKGGVVSLTLTLAQELAPFKIRCVAIAPGLIETPMAERIPEDYRKQMLEHVAAGRLGTPEEAAHAVRFCVENDYFNGRVLELDGAAYG